METYEETRRYLVAVAYRTTCRQPDGALGLAILSAVGPMPLQPFVRRTKGDGGMKVKKVQERVFAASADELVALVADFRMWPTEIVAAPQPLGGRRYQAGMQVWEEFERPGAIRAFRVVGLDGLRGEHWFEVERVDEGVRLRHTIAGEAVGEFETIWRERIEPLHVRVFDAFFDNIETTLGSAPGLRDTAERSANIGTIGA